MGRAVSVHVLISTQRPTVDDLPSGSRNLISQRLALQLRNPADAGIVLGSTPTLPLPRQRGEGLYCTPAAVTAVQLDHLTAEGWAQVCGRAARLRATRAAPDATQPAESAAGVNGSTGQAQAQETPMPTDPMLTAVVGLLADHHPGGLSATAILPALPDVYRDSVKGSVGILGLRLKDLAAAHPAGPPIESARSGAGRVWRLTPVGQRETATKPVTEPVTDPSPGHAQPVTNPTLNPT